MGSDLLKVAEHRGLGPILLLSIGGAVILDMCSGDSSSAGAAS